MPRLVGGTGLYFKALTEGLVKIPNIPIKYRNKSVIDRTVALKNFIEVGPGKALSGMVKRTIKNSNCFSINSIADIKKFQDELKN